jgi:hypothetical protein
MKIAKADGRTELSERLAVQLAELAKEGYRAREAVP